MKKSELRQMIREEILKLKESSSKQNLSEITVEKGLKSVISGSTSRIEGIKLSKELAANFQDWIANSIFGKKYNAQINNGSFTGKFITLAKEFGMERYLDSKTKNEFIALVAKYGK